jgi:YVTN family beta-propeller protein
MKKLIPLLFCTLLPAQRPGSSPDGYLLPTGWRLTPLGQAVATEDMILKMLPTPDGLAAVATLGGYNANGLAVVDAEQGKLRQFVQLPSAWLGLAWDAAGSRLFASGGGCCRRPERGPSPAPIYAFAWKQGRLEEKPVATFTDPLRKGEDTFWTGIAYDSGSNRLYAANRNTNEIVAFDTTSGAVTARWPSDWHPYELLFDAANHKLYFTNISSDTLAVIDTASGTRVGSVAVCDNPNDMALHADGRLFVACANDNNVTVVDAGALSVIERIVTSLHPNAPEGSTPNSLLLDAGRKVLLAANADNNSVAVIDIAKRSQSVVRGFLPTGWYPSSLAFARGGRSLLVGNSKGLSGVATPFGIGIPQARARKSTGSGVVKGSVHTLTKGAVTIVDFPNAVRDLVRHTKQTMANSPYSDQRLAAAPKPPQPSIVPERVGAGSPIKHVLYIIKENRTYDQVLGDLPQGNGDPELTLFGREVTPNEHKIAEEFVLFDNLYCSGEVSSDGHQWSTAAYATDWVEKNWPPSYSGRGLETPANRGFGSLPPSGYIWDAVLRKGLTLRLYGDDCCYVGGAEDRIRKYFAPNYGSWKARDYQNAATFIADLDRFDAAYDSADPWQRLPNFTLMMLPEDHTYGTSPGRPTPTACVASNDLALGRIVERVSHSRYWKETAIFVIEDDAQEGPDHVDARRTIGFVISPYTKRKSLDSTLYTTASMLRTMELLLGLPPLSQYDAGAAAMFNAFSEKLDLTPYDHEKARVNVDEMNQAAAWGARESLAMDFREVDRTPMRALNEIIWKSVRGPNARMPAPKSRFAGADR